MMITKELAKEILEDFGFNVSSSLQSYCTSLSESESLDSGYVYIGLINGNSTAGITNMGVTAELSLRGNMVHYLDVSNGEFSGGNTTGNAVSSPQQFVIFDSSFIGIQTGAVNFIGYRMTI